MKSFTRTKIIGTFLVTFVIVSMAALSVGADPTTPEPQAPQSLQPTMRSSPVLLRWDPTPSNFRVPPPSQVSQLRAQSATITVNYLAEGTHDTFGNNCYTWPVDAKDAFSYAAGIWESLIHSSVPIKIDACWTQLAGNILGQATPVYLLNIPTSTYYAAALANALSESDQNGTTAEMFISYNRTPPTPWYFGTDGNPGSKIDFASVVLHEICHGLGFAGSMTVSGSTGYWGWGLYSNPTIYDRFTERGGGGSGTPLLNYGNGTTALGSALTSQEIFFDNTNANAANGGSPPKLYAPSTWQSGSSYSHLDYDTFNDTENELMVWAISSGESVHDPGPVTLGMLKDMGWRIGKADLRITKQIVGGGQYLTPGDPVTFTLSVENIGGLAATGVVVTDTLSTDILTPTYGSSLTITPTGVISYVWELPNLAANASGVITVYGTISHTMPITGFAIWNTASIGTADTEEDTNNNRSTVLVGGYRVYLPLVLNSY